MSPNNGISPVDGRPKPAFANVVRSSKDSCGSKGIWYTEKELIQSDKLWKLFWNQK